MKSQSSSTGISRHIPLKQRLALEQKIKLKRLVKEFPYISFYLDDDDLKSNMDALLEGVGFVSEHIDVKEKKEIVKRSLYALEKNHLILVNYKRKLDGSNILSFLNELRRRNLHKSFKNIVPVFVANVVSNKDNVIFRALSKFDIRFAIFLNPESSGAAKLEKLFNELQTFQKLIFDDIKFERAEKPNVSLANEKKSKIIEKYKSLLKEAEEQIDFHPEKAIELFTEAIELKPEFDTLVQRGDAYYMISEFIPAIRDYREANKLSKGRSDPFAKISACCFNLVRQQATKGDKDKAGEWFERGIKAFHKAEEIIEKIEKDKELFVEGAQECTHKFLILALSEADFRDYGMEDEERKINSLLSETLQKTKHIDFLNADLDLDARIDYAILLTRQKHYEGAEKIFRSLIQQDVDNAGPAFNNFAVELRKNKEYKKAFEIYTELLKYNVPEKDIVIQNMMMAGRKYAQITMAQNKAEKAIEIYEETIKHAKDTENMEWALCDMASAYLEIQDTERALMYFNMAIKKNKNLVESEQFKSYKPLQGFANAR